MRFKIFSQLVLIVASILCVFVIGFILFAGGSFIEGVQKNGLKANSDTLNSILFLLSLLLFVISVIIAWFERFRFIGSILITIFALVQLLVHYDHALTWLRFSILFVGPLLLILVYTDRWLSKEEK